MTKEQIISESYKKEENRWAIAALATCIYFLMYEVAVFLYLGNNINAFATLFSFAFILQVMTGIITPIFIMENNIERNEQLKELE